MPLPNAIMTDKQYVRSKGMKCPVCRCEDVVGEETDMGSGDAQQEVSCSSCGSSWYDMYKLTGYSIINDATQDDDESEEDVGKDEPDQ